jgi:hypothetical protein
LGVGCAIVPEEKFQQHQQKVGVKPAETAAWKALPEADKYLAASAWLVKPELSLSQAIRAGKLDVAERNPDASYKAYKQARGLADMPAGQWFEDATWNKLNGLQKQYIAREWVDNPKISMQQAIALARTRHPGVAQTLAGVDASSPLAGINLMPNIDFSALTRGMSDISAQVSAMVAATQTKASLATSANPPSGDHLLGSTGTTCNKDECSKGLANPTDSKAQISDNGGPSATTPVRPPS